MGRDWHTPTTLHPARAPRARPCAPRHEGTDAAGPHSLHAGPPPPSSDPPGRLGSTRTANAGSLRSSARVGWPLATRRCRTAARVVLVREAEQRIPAAIAEDLDLDSWKGKAGGRARESQGGRGPCVSGVPAGGDGRC